MRIEACELRPNAILEPVAEGYGAVRAGSGSGARGRDDRTYDQDVGESTWGLVVRQRYRYDASNSRIVKQSLVQEPENSDPNERIALWPFPGDFERRGLTTDRVMGAYRADATLGTESQYMVGGARLSWKRNGQTGLGIIEPEQRLSVNLGDLVGSTSFVVELISQEPLEAGTFYPNGGRETHWTTHHVSLQLEPAGFTALEADHSVGLVYAHNRHLIARIGRWASADPMHIHRSGGGEVLNGYHYVAGNMLQRRDPLGLGDHDSEPSPHPGVQSEVHRGGGTTMETQFLERPNSFQELQEAMAYELHGEVKSHSGAGSTARARQNQTPVRRELDFVADNASLEQAWADLDAAGGQGVLITTFVYDRPGHVSGVQFSWFAAPGPVPPPNGPTIGPAGDGLQRAPEPSRSPVGHVSLGDYELDFGMSVDASATWGGGPIAGEYGLSLLSIDSDQSGLHLVQPHEPVPSMAYGLGAGVSGTLYVGAPGSIGAGTVSNLGLGPLTLIGPERGSNSPWFLGVSFSPRYLSAGMGMFGFWESEMSPIYTFDNPREYR